MLWNAGNNAKPEVNNLGMMPPPTSLVPVAQRRSSTLLDSHSPPVRSMKTELDENSQGSVMDIIGENSVDSIRRFRMNDDDSNMDASQQQSYCDKSNHSEESAEGGGQFVVPHLGVTDLKGVDLRMKAGMGINDLGDTQQPSFETLRKFGVMDQTNMPLQTGQSIENFFLTTLESTVNKNVTSDTLAKNDNALMAKAPEGALLTQPIPIQLLGAEPAAKIFPEVLATAQLSEIIPTLDESHTNEAELIREVLKPEENLILSQLNPNLTPTPKLDALVNSAVESHIGSPTSPQRSPLLPAPDIIISPTPEVILNAQAPMLAAAIPTPELLIRSPDRDILNPPALLGPSLCLPPNDIEAVSHLGMKTTPHECLVTDLPALIAEQNQNDIIMKNLLITQPQTEPVKTELPKIPDQSMINMSENDLISYINPSCFEGTYTS